MLGGVRAPGPPPRAVLDERPLPGRQAQLPGRQLEAKVAGREGIRVSESAHRDHLRCPRADPWQGQQLPVRAVPVGTGIQDEASVGKPGDQRTQRPLPGLRHGEMDGIDLGKLFDRREGVGQCALTILDRLPLGRD